MKRHGLAAAAFLLAALAATPVAAGNQVEAIAWTAEKNFPLLSLISRDPVIRARLASDPGLQAIVDRQVTALEAASADCRNCGGMTKLTAAEIQLASDALRRLYASEPRLRALVAGPLRRSGAMATRAGEADLALLAMSWEADAAALNRIIDVYGTGAVQAPEIDGPMFDPNGSDFATKLESAAQLVLEQAPQQTLFFELTEAYAMRLLAIHRRDEAGRHEPLAAGENARAVQAIRRINWERYPYSVIVVPGQGPDRAGLAIAPESRMRAELAALRWRAAQAPLILVSGGYVHPSQTPFAEAIEMKRILMTEFGVPEQAILVDPHARHTTTNLRNAARQIIRYGIPASRPALITTDRDQSLYIESAAFRDRCQRVFGYQPALDLRRVSTVDLAFRPNPLSLQIDARDPLDP